MRGGDDGARSAEPVEQRQQHEAAGRGAEQVEEIDAVDALDGLRDGQRDDRAGDEERQRGREVDEGQIEVAEVIPLNQDDEQRQQHAEGVGDAEPPQP